MTNLVPNPRARTPDRVCSRSPWARVPAAGVPRALLAVVFGCLALLLFAPAAVAASGSISGTVTEFSGTKGPLAGVFVAAYQENGELAGVAITELQGKYTIEGLAEGSYKVEFVDFPDEKLTIQFYNNAHTLATATPVALKGSETAENINAELRKGGTISGTVEGPSEPLNGAKVVVFGTVEGHEYFREATTEASGKYSVVGLPAGSYRVEFSAPSGVNLTPRFYQEASSLESATKLGVEEEKQYENINAKLTEEGGQISGTVTDATTHSPLEHVLVFTENAEGFEFLAETNATGEYTLAGLASGSYYLEFVTESGEYLAGFKTASVTQGMTTAGVNVALERSPPLNTAPPVLSGTPTVGQSLSCSTGSWIGFQPLTFSYTWLRGAIPIAGTSGNTYVVQPADQGHGLTCQVTAINSVSHGTATSNTLKVPAAPPEPAPPPPPPARLAAPAPSPAPAPPGPPAPPQPPTLAGVSQSHSLWREGNRLATYSRSKRAPVGTTFTFILNQLAVVNFVFSQQTGGREVRGNCVAQTRANRSKPSCKRGVTRGALSFRSHSGLNTVMFQGRLSSSKRLPLGAYKLRITASNSAGERSSPRTLSFTIVK